MSKKKLSLKWAIAIISMAANLCAYPATAQSQWHYKRGIVIENKGDGALDAVIEVKINKMDFDYAMARPNGADLRFFTTAGNKNGAGLPYWIEQWNENGLSRIWVKVPKLAQQDKTKIYMYYGNAGARPVSDGNATFLFFDDFESGNYAAKWKNVSIGEVAEHGGMLKLKESDGEDGIITADFRVTGKMIVRTLYQRGGADQHWTRAGIGAWNHYFCFGDHTEVAGMGTNYVMLYDSSSLSNLATLPLIKAANKVITDQWRRATYWYDGTNLNGQQDDVVVAWPAANASSKLALRTLDNDNWDNFAYITVSAYIGADPTITVGLQENN